ncbi:MAG: mannitol dehydrogenase family protein [Propionibacterium sp.]|nr:mannitol dehydrogenase family protein [Propionibacterium sp.]
MNRIVHLGLGNFHRAHQAVYTADAPGEPWAITGVAHSNPSVVEALRRQNMTYTVVEVGPGAKPARRLAVIDRALVARRAPNAVIAEIADPETHLVTLTITENGYGFRPGSHDLDITDDIRSDATGTAAPRTMMGLLARGLLRRAVSDGTPLSLVSCDNVSGNGSVLRTVLTQFAALMPEPDAGTLGQFLARCATPNTMVDRIVPATTDATRAAAKAAGSDDEIPVPCEPFTMWVLEDAFAGPRPRWEAAGAILTDQVHQYELVKLRLLNATNSLLAYLGPLNGLAYQAEAAQHPVILPVAWRLGDEMQPTIALPDGLDPLAYRKEMFARFANVELRHTCQQVGSDGSAKLTQRVPGPVAWYEERGRVPHVIALLVAAWLHVVTRLDLPAGQAPDEPMHDLLRRLDQASEHPADLARAALTEEAVLGPELALRENFIALVGEYLDDIAAGRLAELLARLGSHDTAAERSHS